MSDKLKAEEVAEKLVRAAIAHVPFDGWSMQTLEMAAADCDIAASDIGHYLPQGVEDAVALYGRLADGDMVAAFAALEEAPQKVHLKIRALILCRLHLAMPHKEAVSKTLSYLAQPQYAALGSKMLYASVDAMWRAAGDSATDISFYSKRATLAAVYSATLLAFLADDSADMAKTEAFLDRRLGDVAKIPTITAPVKAVLGGAASKLASAMAAMAAGRKGPL